MGPATHDLLSSGPGALEVGYCHVGIVDLEAWREGFCGERGGLREGADWDERFPGPRYPGPGAEAQHWGVGHDAESAMVVTLRR